MKLPKFIYNEGLGMQEEQRISFIKEINHLNMECHTSMMKAFHRLFDENIVGQQAVLLRLLHLHRCLNTGEISKLMDVSPSAVSQILSKLEKGQYIKRTINPDNRRETIIELDFNGNKFIEKSEKIEKLMIERVYYKLDEADLIDMHRILNKLKQIIVSEFFTDE